MRYRRDRTNGATYFFTVVTLRREPWFANGAAVNQLREAFRAEMARRPFVIDAIVIMPDHLHTLWSLPVGDADYPIRWRNIKRAFTACIPPDQRPVVFASRQRKREQARAQGCGDDHDLYPRAQAGCARGAQPIGRSVVACRERIAYPTPIPDSDLDRAMLTLYGISNCDTIRKARRWLDARGIAYAFHDYKKQGLDEERLRGWVAELGWEALLNRRGTTWRRLPDEVKAGIDAESAIRLMLASPSIIQRPLLDTGAARYLGFSETLYQELLP